MKPIYVVLILLLATLQYQLWWGDGSIRSLSTLKSNLSMEKSRLQSVKADNQLLMKQIYALKSNEEEIESVAREEYNMIKKDEVYFQVVENNQ